MMSNKTHWDEYAKTGLIIGFMISDALMFKHDATFRDRLSDKMAGNLEKVLKTWELCEVATKVLMCKYFHTFCHFDEGMSASAEHKLDVNTMQSCGRTFLSIIDRDSGAWVTLKGDDPPTEMWLESFAGSEAEIMKILTTAVLPPSGEWVHKMLSPVP